jgi:hypothetical protein
MNQTTNNFTKFNVAVRIGAATLSAAEVNLSNIIELVQKHNKSIQLEILPDSLNPEALGEEKVTALYKLLEKQPTAFFENLKDKTLYLNNPFFLLGISAPTSVESYTDDLKFRVQQSNSSLVMPFVEFGERLNPSDVLIEKAKYFYEEKNILVIQYDENIKVAKANEDHEKLNKLYEELVYLKYARFAAVKTWKEHLEAKSILKNTELEKELNKVTELLDKTSVPPIRH